MLKMLNYVIMVPTASDALLGREGENNSRTLRVKTTDDISAYAEIHLLIDTLDCGAMTVTEVSNYKVLSMVISADMLGNAGCKTCQIVMTDESDTVILKTNRFYMETTSSNDTDRVYICTEDAIKAALEVLIAEGVLTGLELVTDKTLTQANGAADAEATGAAIRTAVTNLTLTSAEATSLISLLED